MSLWRPVSAESGITIRGVQAYPLNPVLSQKLLEAFVRTSFLNGDAEQRAFFDDVIPHGMDDQVAGIPALHRRGRGVLDERAKQQAEYQRMRQDPMLGQERMLGLPHGHALQRDLRCAG